MCSREKEVRIRERGLKNPTFSSILLDEIYRSMANDELDRSERKHCSQNKTERLKFSSGNRGKAGGEEEKDVIELRRACLIEKWMDEKVREKMNSHRKKNSLQFDRDLDLDSLFFSSSSSSSDSSSGGLSSSDNDSFNGTKTWPSAYNLENHPKPIRTGGSGKTEKVISKGKGLHDRSLSVESEKPPMAEDSLSKSKSRALKMYNNLKKVKPPTSPGGRLTTFINSLFHTSQTKKQNAVLACDERKLRIGDESACSSASSFSRSCLSKNTPATREKLRNGIKRNVSFFPDGVMVERDRKPTDQKNMSSRIETLKPVSLSTEWKARNLAATRVAQETTVSNSARFDEEMVWGFLKEYCNRSSKRSEADARGIYAKKNDVSQEDDCDALSCASSDLFELDHLAAAERYREELPVYETTTTRFGCKRSFSISSRV